MSTQNLFSIDGTYYNIRIPQGGIKRDFQVLDDDSAGRVKSGKMFRSIIGTYYNYTIECDTSKLSPSDYDTFYELISAPEDYHSIVVPYGQTTLTFNAYITGGSDVLQIQQDGKNIWSNLSLQFVAVEPKRT